jgi:hypothetical protein
MNTFTKIASACLCAAAALAAPLANAALTNNGDGTFTDTGSGYVWRTLDQYDGLTFTQSTALLPTGFASATASQLAQLAQNTSSDTFATIATAMGVSVDSGLIWGFYGNGSTYAWKEDWASNWSATGAVASDWYNADYTVTANYASTGLSLFAVNTTPVTVSPVPEPSTLAMAALGIVCIGLRRRQR